MSFSLNLLIPIYSEEPARKECDILIGMHIRAGDFREWLDGMYFYDINNFQEAMSQATKVFQGKKIAFLICSNETWDNYLFDEYKVFFGSGQIVEDIYSLSQTDYLVAGYSSYAWWASLTGNVPIYSFLHNKIFEKKCCWKIL
ncbi:MAG: alpha-1,2-fucosyltransferase [Pseudanabaena sp. M046S1SP1A06QC]|nr:alpha-1,2-fucosyltransferase [Pseudanabaena sp. M046S1SP1A06QC]